MTLHHMIQQALKMYHIPEDIQVMLEDYFGGFKMRFLTERYTTGWINLEVGISMGCTISPILLVLAMEVILRAAEGVRVQQTLAVDVTCRLSRISWTTLRSCAQRKTRPTEC
ncbi:reverse transcriptase [Plakobranchus ocellatus]|uniref:Reverse transcriptase n=1 Tax=Plakobranchus ocellatus TaxID=259542 RepID=A0AAV4CWC4_9GAST|nr:reverse transcriptase [Plakobranchus ocellatus]